MQWHSFRWTLADDSTNQAMPSSAIIEVLYSSFYDFFTHKATRHHLTRWNLGFQRLRCLSTARRWTPGKTGATTRSAGAAQTLWMAPVKKRTCEILWCCEHGWNMVDTWWKHVATPVAFDRNVLGFFFPLQMMWRFDIIIVFWCILLVRCPLCLSESRFHNVRDQHAGQLRLYDWKMPHRFENFLPQTQHFPTTPILFWLCYYENKESCSTCTFRRSVLWVCTTFEFRGPHDWYQPHSGEGGFYCALAEYDDSFHWFHAPTSTGSCPASPEQKEITLVQTSFIHMFVSIVSFRLRWGSGHESSGCRAALDGPFPLESCKARLGSTHCGDVKLPASDATL